MFHGLFQCHHRLKADALNGSLAFDLPAAPRRSSGLGDSARAPRAPLPEGISPKVHKVSRRFSGMYSAALKLEQVAGPQPRRSRGESVRMKFESQCKNVTLPVIFGSYTMNGL